VGIPVDVVVADAGYGVANESRAALLARRLSYVVGVTRDTKVWRLPRVPATSVPYRGRGRPRKQPTEDTVTVLEVARDIPDGGWAEVTWQEGTKGPMQSCFAAVRVEPSQGETRGTEAEPAHWLVVEWPEDTDEPTKYFLSNLPEDAPLQELVYWAKIRWWIEQGYQHLKDEL
jgi:SRSO17 transposase